MIEPAQSREVYPAFIKSPNGRVYQVQVQDGIACLKCGNETQYRAWDQVKHWPGVEGSNSE